MLLSMASVLYIAFKISFKNYKYSVLAGLTTIFIYGLVDTPYWKNDLVMIYWMLVALAIISKPKKSIHN